MMLIFALQCICLIVTVVNGGIPLPQPGDFQGHLTKNCQLPTCPGKISSENQNNVYNLPYPTDCLLYIECKGSESRVLPCPPGEVFDKNTFTCAARHKVQCVPCYQETP